MSWFSLFLLVLWQPHRDAWSEAGIHDLLPTGSQGFSTAHNSSLLNLLCSLGQGIRNLGVQLVRTCNRTSHVKVFSQLDDGVLRNLALLGCQHFMWVLLAGMLVDLDYKES